MMAGQQASDPEQKCGLACVIGLPNAGKSTLVNALVGEKVSIVSRKKQTTRFRVCGILMKDKAQIVLVDTPGIFAAAKNFERTMVDAAWQALGDADIVVHLIDAATKHALSRNQDILKHMPRNKPVILVLNKIDETPKPELLKLAQSFNDAFSYEATFMVSALHKQGIDDIAAELVRHLPKGPFLFDPEQTTDLPMRMMAAEITREKIFRQLHEELPYSMFVETESWENFDDGSVRIGQLVYVQRDSQKSIVLGKGGSRIKEIGQAARLELEDMMQCRVHLKLLVKVQEDWQEREDYYRLVGLDKNS